MPAFMAPIDESGFSAGFEAGPRSARTRPNAIVLQSMRNQSMRRKLENAEAIDLSGFDRENNYYVLPFLADNFDYCDAVSERWIWSIGRRHSDGVILASMNDDLYMNDDFECLWLR